MNTPKELLIEWSRWLASQRNYEDAPSDYNGQRHMELNAGRDVWFLAGTWGGSDDPRRTIEIPRGKGLFIVASFACVTDRVLREPKLVRIGHKPGPRANRRGPADTPPKNKVLPISDPIDPDLSDWAREIHGSFDPSTVKVTIDREDVPLTDIETGPFTIDIDIANRLGSYYGYPGVRRTAAVAKAYLLDYVGSSHVITIEADADDDPVSGEGPYNVRVTYNVVPV